MDKWEIVTDEFGEDLLITNSEGYTICEMPKHKDLKANAHLIAAAPVQNKALQAVIFDLETEGEVTMPTVDMIHKALAIAKGGEQ